jgi:hypothetical protein
VKSVSLRKLDYLVSQTGVSGFGRIETSLVEEEDCSTSSSDDDDDDDDDDTDDEYDYEELLLEFKKLISKHIKLQKRHEDLICSHKELMDSYALVQSTHEVMVTKVKNTQPHTCTCAPHSIDLSCANSCCSQVKSSCDEHILVETCDSFIASENDELKRENKILKMELVDWKANVMYNHLKITVITWWRSLRRDQPSHVPNCPKSTWRHLIKRLISPRSRSKHISSALSAQLWDTSHPNIPIKEMAKQSILEDKEAYLREGALVTKKNVTI